MNPLRKKHRINIRRELAEEVDRSKRGEGPFWRKQKNAAKHGARLADNSHMEMLHKCPMFLMERKDTLLLLLLLHTSHICI
jgi:hypothetical protein